MSDEDFEKWDEDEDFAGRRRQAIFGDDGDDEDVDFVGDTEEKDEMDLSQEYPSMEDLPEKDESVREKPDERDLSEEYPTMNEEKKIVSPEEWTLDDEYPSMKDLPKKTEGVES